MRSVWEKLARTSLLRKLYVMRTVLTVGQKQRLSEEAKRKLSDGVAREHE
jgi:hypothetical protein